MNHDHEQDHEPPPFWRTRYGIGLLVLGAVASYFLLTEHLAHVAGALPFLLLLSCPLMHVFMHHGHGHHGGGHSHGNTPSTPVNQQGLGSEQVGPGVDPKKGSAS